MNWFLLMNDKLLASLVAGSATPVKKHGISGLPSAAAGNGYPDGNCINGTATDIVVDTSSNPSFTTGCYDFNGSSSKVSIADSLITTAGSLSAWFRTNSATGNQSVFGETGTLGMQLYFGLGTMRCSQGGGGSQLVGTTTIVADTWYNIILTKTAGVGDAVTTMYLNGISTEDSESDWSDLTSGATSLISGHQTDYWNGFITDFAIWNTVISSDIRDEINAGSGTLISDLSTKDNITTYYPCNALDGTTVTNIACP